MNKPSFFVVPFLIIQFFFSQFVLASNSQFNKTLDQFYKHTQSMQANFEQSIYNSQGRLIEQSQGKLMLSRPDKFILHYQTPAEQQYISNGKTIWIFDVELEQVSIKSLDEGVGDSPALLLSSNNKVYKHYLVNNVIVGGGDDFQWVQLLGKSPEMTFERVLLAFKENHLVQMRLFDSFGQTTLLKFSDITTNQPFSNRQFEFVPPDDVDIIGTVNAQ